MGKPAVKSNLKSIHVASLDNRKLSNTVWGSIGSKVENKIQFTELEDLFTSAKVAPAPGAAAPKKEELINFCDETKRKDGMNIMARKFKKLQWAPLRDAVLNLDSKVLSADDVQLLIKWTPSSSEFDVARHFNDELDKIDEASRFILEMVNVPRMQPRLRNFMFTLEFSQRKEELDFDSNAILQAVLKMKNDLRFLEFLKVCLDLVNTFNRASGKPEFGGLKLDTVYNLYNTSSAKGNTNLIDYCLGLILTQKPETLDFIPELHSLSGKALKINSEGKSSCGLA